MRYRGTKCLNCGHNLDISDRFCPQCSQANSTKKLGIKDFIEEFFSNFIAYDSKLWKTLSALLFRPGRITQDYIAGKRTAYTNPFRFLLSLGIIYFLMFSITRDFDQLDKLGTNNDPDFFNVNIDLREDLDQQEHKNMLDSLALLKNQDRTAKERDSLILANPVKTFKSIRDSSLIERYLKKERFFNAFIRKDPGVTFGQLADKYSIPHSLGNRMSFQTARSLFKIGQQPGTFASAVISRLPFAIFFFLPAFALFLWLTYIRKKYTYADHLIFSFHNTALFFILLIISYLIDLIFKTDSNWVFLIIFSIYLFQAMRKFYGQGIFTTIVKYLFLNIIFFILAGMGIVLLLTGSLFTY